MIANIYLKLSESRKDSAKENSDLKVRLPADQVQVDLFPSFWKSLVQIEFPGECTLGALLGPHLSFGSTNSHLIEPAALFTNIYKE